VISLSFLKHTTTNIDTNYANAARTWTGAQGKCRTYAKWAATTTAGVKTEAEWDTAYGNCENTATKTLCEDATNAANKCHWVAPGDEVPKWYFEVSQTHRHGHKDVSKRASVTCVVGSNEDTCPDPKCSAADHHDTNAVCDHPHVVMVRRNAADSQTATVFSSHAAGLTANAAAEAANIATGGVDALFPRNAGATYEGVNRPARYSGDDRTYADAKFTHSLALLADRDNAQLPSNQCTPSADKTCVSRAVLGQYLVTYTASDESGNQAEPVAFSFLFVDPFVPVITLTKSKNGNGQSNIMYGYPQVTHLSTYVTSDLVGSTAGAAIFPGQAPVGGTGGYGCGSSCKPLATDDANSDKQFGAFYSPISGKQTKTETVNRAAVTDIFENDFDSSSPATEGEGATDAALSALTHAEIANLNFDHGTQTAYLEGNADFEAGTIGKYGGFYCPAEHVEHNPDLNSGGFCLPKIGEVSPTCETHVTSGDCGNDAQCKWYAATARTEFGTTTQATLAYNVAATAADNYRTSTMQVYYQWREDSATTAWSAASGSKSVVMSPGKEVQISWFVEDLAGDFGFRQMSNPQTHTVQFRVTDNTRPILMAGKKMTSYDKATFAEDPTAITQTALQTLGYNAAVCSDFNSEALCTGTCTWNDATGCSGATAQHCASTLVSSGTTPAFVVTHDARCEGKSTAATCWGETNGKCFWTSSTIVKDLAWTDKQSGVALTCGNGLTKYTYKQIACTRGTNDVNAVKNAQCTGGITFTGTGSSTKMTYNVFEKCRPTTNSATNYASPNKNEYTVTAECGYDENGDARWTHKESGVRVYDNWDNVVTSSTTTTVSTIDLFTDVGSETGVKTDSAKATPAISTSIHATSAIAGTGGYGALDNRQLVKSTASSVCSALNTAALCATQPTCTWSAGACSGTTSEWNLRGMYYRSGLATHAGTDFYNDFLVVYKYTDSSENSARPLLRKIVSQDTTPPSIRLVGDQTLENSAGSYVHATQANQNSANNVAECVTKADREAACSTYTGTNSTLCNRESACIWSYADADEMETSGDGLFDQDRIVKYFQHRDDCDKDLITTVTLHNGLGCPTATKVSCTVADDATNDNHACFAGVFQYTGDDDWQAGGTNLLDNVGTTGTGSRWQKFPEWTAGSYSIKYQAEDSAGHTTSVCRDILNVDHTFPIIQILGSDQMTLEATHQGNYIDDGATCSDQVDGVISQNVEVSGDVVNLSKVGTYTITYNCKDSANNAAPAARRTVVVAQTSCPRCTIYGAQEVNHEASFPYADPGARCSDVIDGSTATKCYKSAVDGAPDLTTAVDCGSGMVQTDTTGTYKIEYRAENTVGLWNDDSNCRGGAISYRRTVVVMDTLRPVITLTYNKDGAVDGDATVAAGTAGNHDGQSDGSGAGYLTQAGLGTNKGTTKSGYTSATHNGQGAPYPGLTGAAVDQGNFNPAHANLAAGGWNMMAEESTSSVNGWVVGAIASAVAGLALLGYSTRRTAVATSVPV